MLLPGFPNLQNLTNVKKFQYSHVNINKYINNNNENMYYTCHRKITCAK